MMRMLSRSSSYGWGLRELWLLVVVLLAFSLHTASSSTNNNTTTTSVASGNSTVASADNSADEPRNRGITEMSIDNSTAASTSTAATEDPSLDSFPLSEGAKFTKGVEVIPGGPLSHSVFKDSLFYMYDLPEEFWWRWPVNGTQQSCVENGYLGHEHAELSAIGRPIRPDDGLFLTWHFSMFNSLYNRLKRSSRRTKDPSKASLFIIPYDLGLDGYLNPSNCQNRRSCSGGLVGKLTKILNDSPYFKRHGGGDHVLLWSLGQYHPWPRAGCDVFMKETCEKCTITCYWMDPTKAENRFVSMPFPSAYHWWDNIQNVPWDINLASQRNMTAVYLGSTQTLNPYHTKIRRAMATQCNTSSECHWLKIAHSSIDNNIGDFLSIYKKAVFCLCPPGDDPARKAVFDAIVSGCIPVIFEVATLYNQYPWHIGEQAALDVSVYVPGGLVRTNKLDFMSVLLAIKPETIRKKQLALAQLAPRVQYAIPPIDKLQDRFDETPWDPPFLDGAEIALEGFFERTSHIVNNQSTGIPHRLMTGREWGQEYEGVKVQVPRRRLAFGQQANTVSSTTTVAESQAAAGNAVDVNQNGGLHEGGKQQGEHSRQHHRQRHGHGHHKGNKGGAAAQGGSTDAPNESTSGNGGGKGGKHGGKHGKHGHKQGVQLAPPGEEENREVGNSQ